MRNISKLFSAAAVLLLAGQAPALVVDGLPEDTGSWKQSFYEHDVGTFDHFQILLTSGPPFQVPVAINNFNVAGWQQLYSDGTRIIAQGPEVSIVYFDILFSGDRLTEDFTFIFQAWDSDAVLPDQMKESASVVWNGSSWDIQVEAVPSMTTMTSVWPVIPGESIQAAIDAAASGDIVTVADGTYPESLVINKPLTLAGQSELNTIIDASGSSAYAIGATGDHAFYFHDFTLLGNPNNNGAPAANTQFGLKVSGENGLVDVRRVTIQNCFRTAFDFNGLAGSIVEDCTASGSIYGVGLGMSDCSNITIDGLTTSGNDWAGMALYAGGFYYGGGCDNITIVPGSFSYAEPLGLYTEEANSFVVSNFSVALGDFGALSGNTLNPGATAYVVDVATAQAGVLATDPLHGWVSSRSGGHFEVVAGMSIQAAIDAADPGDTIDVAAGLYEEQLYIDKDNLVLQGAGEASTTVLSPTNLPLYYTTSTDNHPIIFVENCTGVQLNSMTVDGDGRGNANYRFQGIGFWNAGGTVTNVDVVDVMDTPFSGAQHGVGIYAYNNTGGPYSISLTNVDVTGFQKGGIAFNGTGLTANATNCSAIGAGPTGVTAQNGIQYYGTVGGTLTDCTVGGTIYTGSGWAASGLLLFEGGTINIVGGTVENGDPAVYCQDSNASATGLMIDNNDPDSGNGFYTRIQSGMAMLAESSLPQEGEPSVFGDAPTGGSAILGTSNVVLLACDFSGQGTGYGVASSNYQAADVIDVTMNNCWVRDWAYGIVTFASGGEVAIQANENSLVNGVGAYFVDGITTLQDLGTNWWGTTDPDVIADDLLYGPIDYSPWLASGLDADGMTPGFQGYFNELWVGPGGSIQEAIDAVVGSTVHVAAGVYNEAIEIEIPLNLIGEDGAIMDGTGLGTVIAGIHITSSDVVVENIDLQYYGDYDAGEDANGIVIGYGTTPANLQNVEIRGCAISYIESDEAPDGHDPWGCGIYAGHSSYDTTPFLDYSGLVIEDNEVTNIKDTALTLASVTAGTGQLEILGNTLSDCVSVAFWIDAARNVLIQGNTITDSRDGIYITSLPDPYFVPNSTYGPRYIEIVGNTITGHFIDSWGYASGNGVIVFMGWPDDIDIHNCYIVGNQRNGVYNRMDSGGSIDATSNWWGDASGPSGVGPGSGDAVTARVLYDPWSPGLYHVDHTADVALISVADGVDYTDRSTLTYAISPADPAAGWRQVTTWVEWDPSYVDIVSVDLDPDFNHSNDIMFTYDANANPMEISLSILGGLDAFQLQGTDLFNITFDGIAEPPAGVDYKTPIEITGLAVRGVLNNPLPGTFAAPLDLQVDGTPPVMQPDSFFDVFPGVCIGDDEAGVVEADDNIEMHSVQVEILPDDPNGPDFPWAPAQGGGLGPNLVGPNPGPLAWVLDFDFYPLVSGTYTLSFRPVDEVGYIGAPISFPFRVDIDPATPITALDLDPQHHAVDLAWTGGSEHDGYKIYRAKRALAYPYGDPTTAEPFVDGGGINDNYGLIATINDPNVNVYLDDFIDDLFATRGIYDYAIVTYDCANGESAPLLGASTNYYLGDVAKQGDYTGTDDYDGIVFSADLNLKLSLSYGTVLGDVAFDGELDFAPTTGWSNYGLPLPDDAINFEDLIIFSMNYGQNGPELPQDNVTAAGELIVRLEQGESHPELVLPAGLKGLSVRLSCDTELSAVNAAVPAFFYLNGEEWVVDMVALNGTIPEGTRAELVFADVSRPEILSVDGRSITNRRLELGSENALVAELPQRFELAQNFPNPFNPTTQIRYALPEAADVRMVLFNSLGQEVRTLVSGSMEAGWHELRLDATGMASGVYFYRIQAGTFTDLKKMILIK